MLFALELLVLVAIAAAAAIAGYRVGRARPRAGLGLAAVGLVALFAGPLMRLFPALMAIPMPHPLTLEVTGALAFLLWGSATGILAERRGARVAPVLLGLLWACWLLPPGISRALHLSEWSALPGQRTATHHLQSTAHTCACACAATVLASRGVAVTEGELARRCRTSSWGTSGVALRAGIDDALAARGRSDLRAVLRGGVTLATLPPPPAILQVYAVRLDIGHAIVYLGRDGDHLLIGDPLRAAVQRLTEARFLERYRWRFGQLVEVVAR